MRIEVETDIAAAPEVVYATITDIAQQLQSDLEQIKAEAARRARA